MEKVVWTPTAAEVSAVIRGVVVVVLRRSFAVVGAACVGIGLVGSLVAGPAATAPGVAIALAILVPFFTVVTYSRNARVIRAAYPVGVEASAEATDDGLRLVSAAADVQLPWSRLARPRVGAAVVAFRDTLTGRPTAVPRQLFPDEWLPRLDPTSS